MDWTTAKAAEQAPLYNGKCCPMRKTISAQQNIHATDQIGEQFPIFSYCLGKTPACSARSYFNVQNADAVDRAELRTPMHPHQYQIHATSLTASSSLRAFGFGEFRLDLVREQLVGPAGHRVLRRKAFATLRLLLEVAPALVTMDELLDVVWGRHAISPSAVPHVILELRRALGDCAEQPHYIETRHRRGYRMIPRVVRELAPPSSESTGTEAAPVWHDGNTELLRLIEDTRSWSALTSPRERLEQLHQAANKRGLFFMSMEIKLAMQICTPESPPVTYQEDTALRT
jgi:DNA-binding winged helix-turn-helix (wHTH) protein